jgi:hypothetical protein
MIAKKDFLTIVTAFFIHSLTSFLMKKLTVLSAAFFSFNAWAHIDCLVGDYINAQGENIFSVTEQHHSGILINTKTGEQITLNMLKEKQISSLWKQMHWAARSAQGAECAADKKFKNVVCEISDTNVEPKFNHHSNIYLNEKGELMLVRQEN